MTMNRKELQAELKEIREDFNIEINLRASTETLQEVYDYWVTSGRINIKRRLKTLAKMRTRAIKNPERLAQIDAEWVQLWERYDSIDNGAETINTSANVEPQTIETLPLSVNSSENLETLEFPRDEILETLENQTPSTYLEYTLGQAVIRCHGKDEKTLLGTVTSIDDGMFIVTCLDGIEYWEDDLNILPDTRVNRINYGLSAPQTSNVIDMFTRKPLQV